MWIKKKIGTEQKINKDKLISTKCDKKKDKTFDF